MSDSVGASERQDLRGRGCLDVWKEAYAKANGILKAGRYTGLARQAERIDRWVRARTFSVVIVGEFSRGKSRLINELLGRPILPVRVLPTTALRTTVTYHKQEMLVYIGPDGKKTGYPLKEQSWQRFLAREGREDPQGSLYVGVDLPWLARHRLELVDTPGTGDFVAQRTTLAEEALTGADGVILTISANNPVSSTERKWIQSRLLAREVPRMMVVITKLDQIDAESRARVVTHIRDKIREISPAVEVCVSRGWESGAGVPGGREAIISRLLEWADAPEHSRLREQAARDQLAGLLTMAADDLRDRAEQARAQRVQKAQDQQQAVRRAAEEAGRPWDDMVSDLEGRTPACISGIRSFAAEKEQLLLEKFRYELSHVAEPKRWWEEDYTYRMKTEMTGFSTAMEQEFTRLFSDDLRVINEAMARNFRQTLSIGRVGIMDKDLIEVDTGEQITGLEDIQKKRVNFQVGRTLATAAGYVLLAGTGGPAAIVTNLCLGAGSTVLGEKVFRSSADVQRGRVFEAVKGQVEQFVRRALSAAEGNITLAYRRVCGEIAQRRALWLDTQTRKPAESLADERGGSLDKLLLETEELIAGLTGKQGGGTDHGALCQDG